MRTGAPNRTFHRLLAASPTTPAPHFTTTRSSCCKNYKPRLATMTARRKKNGGAPSNRGPAMWWSRAWRAARYFSARTS